MMKLPPTYRYSERANRPTWRTWVLTIVGFALFALMMWLLNGAPQ